MEHRVAVEAENHHADVVEALWDQLAGEEVDSTGLEGVGTGPAVEVGTGPVEGVGTGPVVGVGTDPVVGVGSGSVEDSAVRVEDLVLQRRNGWTL